MASFFGRKMRLKNFNILNLKKLKYKKLSKNVSKTINLMIDTNK